MSVKSIFNKKSDIKSYNTNIIFKRTNKWENELNKCIRCGYCYELCPLFKSFNWESDTPRGKLLLIYGMITGDIKPSKEIAEKIFQCFYCLKCSDNCSAGVPVTEILTDARADLLDAGFDVDGTIVKIDEDLCSVCGICLSVCKYDALSLDGTENNQKIKVDKVECKGCGLCVAACPSGSISQKEGFEITLPEMHKKVQDILKEDVNKKVIIFCCNWALFPGMQLSDTTTVVKMPYGLIVTMCSGRVTPELILDAFEEGAWGVMIAGCPPDECDHNGNYKARRRLLLLQNFLKEMNVDPERVRLEWFSSNESVKLRKSIEDFAQMVNQLGSIDRD
ncbi:hydrogenase iron-sulfur subunit [Candidatus Woesearchaeota archaeon]|nr:hydrogenase iron-sulfur subunit [Candidatus Woesearchaeota archaeon]